MSKIKLNKIRHSNLYWLLYHGSFINGYRCRWKIKSDRFVIRQCSRKMVETVEGFKLCHQHAKIMKSKIKEIDVNKIQHAKTIESRIKEINVRKTI